MKFLQTRYRIVGDTWAGYEVQRLLWWWPFWHMPPTNTHSTIEKAQDYIAKAKANRRVYWEDSK